jgi:putative ABC transport system permease protein
MGDIKLAIFLAYKSIFRGNRWALVLIVTVMALSFANLLLTPSILLGVTEAINRQQVETVYGNVVIDPPAEEYYLDGATRITELVAQVPGVAGVSPRLNHSALVEYRWRDKNSPEDKGQSGTWSVVGIDPLAEAGVTTIDELIIEGRYLEENDRDAIILGIEIAGIEGASTAEFQTLHGVQVGDTVRLTYPNGVQREYTVKGIFHAREMRTDRTAFVTRTEMASVFGRTFYANRASQILVSTVTSAAEADVISNIEALGIDAEVRSWSEYGSAMGGVVSSFDVVAGLISGIGLIVAGIVMFIVIYINVIHSRRHIGILRAIGIKTDVIIGSYLAQALFYAAAGVLLGGMAFGLGIQEYFAQHPLNLSIGQVSLALQPSTVQNAIAGLIGAAVLAGLIPVLSITRQGIIKAIWGS